MTRFRSGEEGTAPDPAEPPAAAAPGEEAGEGAAARRAARTSGRTARRPSDRLPPYLTITRLPTLRRPVLVMAFEGWNDAGEAASMAARLVVAQHDEQRFASIDPEEFFVFTDTRPHLRITSRGRRRIEWPGNEFFACPASMRSARERDVIVLLGTEPDLRWRRFGDIVLEVARRAGVESVVALGSLYADVPHTAPPRINAYAASPSAEHYPLFSRARLRSSKYEGPTGIISVLSSRFANAGYPVINLWAHAPHYISASPNPVVAARLLREAAQILDLTVDLSQLDEAAQQFDEQVREAVARDPEATAFVRELERQYAEESEEEEDDELPAHPGAGELPSGASMIDALEEFLRRSRRPPGPGGTAPPGVPGQ